MTRRIALAALAAMLVGAALITVSSASGDRRPRTLTLLDVAAPIDTFIDEGTAGPSTGDVEVFRDTLVWAADRRAAGKAEGKCTLIELSTGIFECTIVTTLDGGTLTTEGIGVLAPGQTSTAAVTGGTGVFEDAGGHATLVFHPGGGPVAGDVHAHPLALGEPGVATSALTTARFSQPSGSDCW